MRLTRTAWQVDVLLFIAETNLQADITWTSAVWCVNIDNDGDSSDGQERCQKNTVTVMYIGSSLTSTRLTRVVRSSAGKPGKAGSVQEFDRSQGNYIREFIQKSGNCRWKNLSVKLFIVNLMFAFTPVFANIIQGSYRLWKVLESPEIKMLRFQGLESPGKRHRSWKTLEKSWNSEVVVLKILLSGSSVVP